MSSSSQESSTSADNATRDAVDLKVLYQMTELDSHILFKALPRTTTVLELKSKIQAAIPSRPRPERQRLIYRGRVMAVDNESLVNVFGREAIDQSAQQTIHLVIRESQAPGQRNTVSQPTLQEPTMIARPPAVLSPGIHFPQHLANNQGPVRSSSPGVLQQGPFAVQPGQTPPNAPLMPLLPPSMHQSPAFNQHLQQHLQMVAQMNRPGQPPFPTATAQAQPATGLTSTAGEQSQAASPEQMMQQHREQLERANAAFQDHMRRHGQASQQENQMRGVHVNNNQNGAWSYNVNSGSMPGPMPMLNFRQFQPGYARMPNVHGQPVAVQSLPGTINLSDRDLQNLIQNMRDHQSDLDDFRQTIDRQARLPEEVPDGDTTIRETIDSIGSIVRSRNLHQAHVNNILADPHLASRLNPADIATLQSLNSTFLVQNQEMLRSLNRRFADHRGQSRTQTPQPQASANTSNQPNPHASSAVQTQSIDPSITTSMPVVYLLSSPSGPSALVFTPSGTYTGASMLPLQPSRTVSGAGVSPQQDALLRQRIRRERRVERQFAGRDLEAQAALPAAPPAVQDMVQRHVDDGAQLRNILRMIMPLFGHLWLLIRLFGFIWFFSNGNGLRRPLILGAAATVFFIAQLGLFRAHWDRLRGHFENLLGIQLGDRPAGQRQDQRNERGRGQNQVARNGPRREPDARETAERLLREQRERDTGWLRERLRGIERVVALFFASLYPGVGERHIAAREEERRQREQQQRQEEEQRAQGLDALAPTTVSQTALSEGEQNERSTDETPVSGIQADHTTEASKSDREGIRVTAEPESSTRGEGSASAGDTADASHQG